MCKTGKKMRPLCLIYYGSHDAGIDKRIINVNPTILVDNTPGGFWHGNCNPKTFQSKGINVFSYIFSNYGKTPDTLNQKLIDAIAVEGAYGVFIDQCNSIVTPALAAICIYAHIRGLKVIINPGTPNIDASLYKIADYVLTDEHYTGREPNIIELNHLKQTIVVGFNILWTAEQAAGYTNKALSYGFTLSWHEQVEYITLPDWLENYVSAIKEV